ncbi:MAG: SAM-dependent methyltransferase [Aquabacterium sp.]|nr:MAG: SAM-dependent methyltransferase [Aquabacterium sp.]
MTLPTDAQRLFHGRGGVYPGSEPWALDWYPPVLLLTCHQPVSEAELAPIQAALTARWAELMPDQPLNLVFQHRDEVRADTRLLCGAVPDPHVVSEQGAQFKVHLMRGFNHGLFLDMAEGRRWVREHVTQASASNPRFKVLNLFAYTCAFSVVALQGGAAQVVNLDMSQGALAVGQQNHRLNDLPAKARFLGHDIFKTWGKINKMGPYGVIVIDPPSYQKGSFIATKDYIKLIRRLPDLLEPQGHVLLCLNAPELDTAFLHAQVAEAAPGLRFVERLANPAAFADIDPEKSLKVLHYQNA